MSEIVGQAGKSLTKTRSSCFAVSATKGPGDKAVSAKGPWEKLVAYYPETRVLGQCHWLRWRMRNTKEQPPATQRLPPHARWSACSSGAIDYSDMAEAVARSGVSRRNPIGAAEGVHRKRCSRNNGTRDRYQHLLDGAKQRASADSGLAVEAGAGRQRCAAGRQARAGGAAALYELRSE